MGPVAARGFGCAVRAARVARPIRSGQAQASRIRHSSRGIASGQAVDVFNARGRFRAKAVLADSVKPGVVVSLGLYWRKYTDDGVNCNSTTSTATTDLGGGGTFFDNLVEVAAV